MTITYQSFNISGYTTGTTGLETNRVLYFYVSGLKYGTETLNFYKRLFTTGYAYISGNTMTSLYSGVLFWEQNNDRWEGSVVVSDTTDVGHSGACSCKWAFNSGAINDSLTGFSTGVIIFKSASENAWDLITSTNGSVQEASSQHYHSGSAPANLSDLGDVNIPGIITDGNALVYNTSSGGWTTGVAGTPIDTTGYEAVSGSWVVATGDLSDYKYVSGRYALTSGSYNTLSGSYATLSGTVKDYAYVSGRYALTSGSYNLLSGSYATLSGSYNTHQANTSIHFTRTGLQVTGSTSAPFGSTGSLIFAAGNGTGIQFWNSASYMIGMAAVAWQAAIGGSPDYNLYYKIGGGGTNRGHIFVTNSGTVAQIDGTGNFYNKGKVQTWGAVQATGISEFTGTVYIGNVAGGKYFKLSMDGTNLRIDSIGGGTILVSGNISGIQGTKIYGSVLL